MLRLLSVVPLLSASRALADGTSGTLGADVVTGFEVREGSLPHDRLQIISSGQVLGRGVGENLGAPRALQASELRAVLDSVSPQIHFASRQEAEAAQVPPSTDVMILLGYAYGYDGGGAQYLRAAAEPAHKGKLQSADGQWWELAETEPNPLMFGALWNDETDDAGAINDCADFCRATRRPMRLPAGKAWVGSTLFLGGLDVTGAGNSRAGLPNWYLGSGTLLRCGGNPCVAKNVPGSAKLGGGRWSSFEIRGMGEHYAGPPIDLYDVQNYPYQIGVWVGRSFVNLSRGSAIADGAAWRTIEDISIRDVSGWGLYAHMSWGQSLMQNCTFHSCGGEAAAGYDDDLKGGAVCFDNCGVDWIVRDIHGINWSYDEGPYRGRGTFVRVGSKREDVEALGGTNFGSGGNNTFDRIHCESFYNSLAVLQSNDIRIDNARLTGPNVIFGWPGNPPTHGRIAMGRWAVGMDDGIHPDQAGITIWVQQKHIVDLGVLNQPDNGQPIVIDYCGSFRGRVASAHGKFALGASVPNSGRPIFLRPNFELTPQHGGSADWLPFADYDYPYHATAADNLLPPIPDPVASPYAFGGSGTVQSRVDARRVRLARGGSGNHSEIRASLSLEPGELYTLAFRTSLYGAAMDYSQLTFGVRGPALTNIERLGSNLLGASTRTGTLSGTLAVSNGSAVVTGTGTLFRDELMEGTRITIDGATYVVVKIESDTKLYLLTPWLAASSAGLSATYMRQDFNSVFAINFLAPRDGDATVYVRSTATQSLYVEDLTVVRGVLSDFPVRP